MPVRTQSAALASTMQAQPIRVLLVDEDPLARRAIRAELTHEPGFTLTGEAAAVEQAVDLARSGQPQVVVIDVPLASTDGIIAVRRILQAAPQTAVVILSADYTEEMALLALYIGAVGYMSKDMELPSLPRAIRAVVRGELAISRTSTTHLGRYLRARPRLRAEPGNLDLSGREWDVLDGVCLGRAPDQIAASLGVSPKTVRRHFTNVVRKFGTDVADADTVPNGSTPAALVAH